MDALGISTFVGVDVVGPAARTLVYLPQAQLMQMWLYLVSMFVGLGLGFANALKKVVSPPLILAYAAVEGVFLDDEDHTVLRHEPQQQVGVEGLGEAGVHHRGADTVGRQ